MDASSSVEEEMSHVRLEAERLGRHVVGDPVVVETTGPNGSGWWLSVLVERGETSSDELALASA